MATVRTWAVSGKAYNARPAPIDCSIYTEGSGAYEECMKPVMAFYMAQIAPIWGVFVIVPASVILGGLITIYVEEPARKLLRAKGGIK